MLITILKGEKSSTLIAHPLSAFVEHLGLTHKLITDRLKLVKRE
jgi:sulfur transfer protein SufE